MSLQGTITIQKSEYLTLKEAELKLVRLENGGVDNWEWYDASLNPADEINFCDACDALRKDVIATA